MLNKIQLYFIAFYMGCLTAGYILYQLVESSIMQLLAQYQMDVERGHMFSKALSITNTIWHIYIFAITITFIILLIVYRKEK